MALLSLGRNVAVAETVKSVGDPGNKTADEVRKEANKKLDEARKGILDALTPWIPGDFVVTYGILLTTWPEMRASFFWLIVVAICSALVYVVLGAFSETGFRKASERSKKAKTRLTIRTVAGFFVSVFAAVAIPSSGWYDFAWFKNHELQVVITASILVAVIVLFLKGLQKRLKFSLAAE